MVQHGSISAWVTVDGHSLEEYGEDLDETNKKITCWIPSEAGKAFQIHLKHKRAALDTGTDFYVDGSFARGEVTLSSVGQSPDDDDDDSDSGDDDTDKTATCAAVITSPTTERSLIFAGLELSDDDALLSNVASEDGDIRIEHWHIELGNVTKESPLTKFKEVGKVHETSKKAVTHCAGLGAEKSIPEMGIQECDDLECLLTVIFRYRPLAMLRANGIAPPPTPVASTSNKRPAPTMDVIEILSDDSEDGIAKLEAKLARLRKKVKREPRVKKEQVKTEGYIIDITFLRNNEVQTARGWTSPLCPNFGSGFGPGFSFISTLMVQRDSISAWVTVDGIPLPEYEEEWNEANDEVTCWIPSETGKEFQVHLKDESPIHDTSTVFHIDGTVARRKLSFSRGVGLSRTHRLPKTASCTSIRTSPTTERTLVFASLNISDDDSLVQDKVADVGEIRIEHWHVRVYDMSQDAMITSFQEVHKVHERLKQANVRHRTGLGAERLVPEVKGWRSKDVTLLLTVIFRYRPLGGRDCTSTSPSGFRSLDSNNLKRSAPTEDGDVIDISSDDSDDDMHIANLMVGQ